MRYQSLKIHKAKEVDDAPVSLQGLGRLFLGLTRAYAADPAESRGVVRVREAPEQGLPHGAGPGALDFVTPKEFSLGNEVKNEGGEVKVVEKKIAKGTANGRISLRLSLEPVP